jgi:hypothetical protein
MKARELAILATLLVALTGAAQAQEGIDHEKHHPPGSKPAAVAPAPAPKADQQKFDKQMHAMHEMHQKMMQAKTPEERSALASDHMKSMRDGMDMMKSSANMHKRMEMMQKMMEMMMDRMEAMPMAPKDAH